MWGVGATTLELLTGDPPFFDLNPYQAMQKISECSLKNELKLNDSISRSLQNLIFNCFENNPEDRPSIEELLQCSLFSL